MRYSFYFIKTLYDVVFKRVIGRLFNDIKKIFFKIIPTKLISILLNPNSNTPKYRRVLNALNDLEVSSEEKILLLMKYPSHFLIRKKSYLFQLRGTQKITANFGDLIYIILIGEENF